MCYIVRILLFLLVTLFIYTCKKSSCTRSFEFHFPATITEGDTFSIGDTLWMNMTLPNQLTDHQTGNRVDLSGFDLYFGFSIDKLDTIYVHDATADFELLEAVGHYREKQGGRFTAIYAHFKSITEKELRLGLVPRKRGVYMLALALPIEYGLAEEPTNSVEGIKIIPSSCYQRITEYSGTRFNSGRINYSLIAQYPCSQASPTDTLTICNKDSTFTTDRGGYAFVVR